MVGTGTPLLLLLCAAATLDVRLVSAANLPPAFPYTLHVNFIRFTQEPESQSVLTGTKVTLSCSTNIVNSSNYLLPELHWRFNGQLLNSSHDSRIVTLPNNSHSELRILSASLSDSGYYECAVFDGYHVLDSGEVDYFAVISSSRASLEVLDVNLTVSDEERTINYTLGQSLILPCETGVPRPPDHATWRKDGDPIMPAENVAVLSDGTLLVLETSGMSEGTYQCTGYYSDEPLNSTIYTVSMGLTDKGGDSAVIIDGPAGGVVAAGEQLALTCYSVNSEGLQLQWLKDGQVLNVSKEPCCNKIVLTVSESSELDSGTYTCQAVSDSGPTAETEINVTIASKPDISIQCKRQLCQEDTVRTYSLFPLDLSISLTCQTSTQPSSTVYWYRNGVDFHEFASGDKLHYTVEDPDDLLGVYQCFAVTPAGVDYATLRVLRAGFSNSPGNFTCQAVDQISDATKPGVVLSWERPTLQAYYLDDEGFIAPPLEGAYKISYEAGGITHNVTVGLGDVVNDSAIVDLQRDDKYTFYVYFELTTRFLIDRVAIASCTVNTVGRIFTPRRLSVACPGAVPDGGLAEIPVEWVNPQISPDFPLLDANFKSVCLYGGALLFDDQRLFPLQNSYKDGEVLSAEVGPLNPGTICLFVGFYTILPLSITSFDSFDTTVMVPYETCAIPASHSTGRAQLRVTCSESMAAVEVVTPGEVDTVNSSQLQGRCITPDRVNTGGTTELYLEPGQSSIGDLPDGTICSFYGNYTLQSSDVEYTFEPAQCIVNQPIPTPETPPTTPTTTQSPKTAPTTTTGDATDYTLEIATGTGSGSSLSRAAIIWLSVNISLAVLVTVAVVIACFVWRDYTHRVVKERRKQLHAWDDLYGQVDLDQDPHVLPQFPNTLYQPDAFSVNTEVDYLYKEEGRAVVSKDSLSSLMKAMENDEKIVDSPKLIMDRFLNGCHERVWECSHESLTAPHEPSDNKLKSTEPCESNDLTVPDKSHLRSRSHECLAQHYTIPLKSGCLENASEPVTDKYIPSGGSSGYGTCSDHYFESTSSGYTAAACDYFKSRLADVAECNSLSTCGEEDGHQSMVAVTKLAREPSHNSLLECSLNSDLDVRECHSKAHRTQLSAESTGRRVDTERGATEVAGRVSLGVSCADNELVSRRNCLTPASLPPEHCFTDDEGYLRFVNETVL